MAGRWSELPPPQPEWKKWRPAENRPHIHWAERRPVIPPEMEPATEWIEQSLWQRIVRYLRDD